MNDLATSLVMFLVVGVLTSTLVARFEPRERPFLLASFFAHQLAGVANILITEHYYGGGDMLAYASQGRFLAGYLRADFFGLAPDLVQVLLQMDHPLPIPGPRSASNTGSMQVLSGFLMLVANNSLYATCVLIGAASFLSKVSIYRTFKDQFPRELHAMLCVACLLVPSAVFWSSALLKEAIAVVGLGMMVRGGYLLSTQGRYLTGTLLFGFGTLIVGLFKGYILPPFGIGAGLWFASRAIQKRAGGVFLRTRYLLIAAVVAIGAVVGTGAVLPQFSPETFAEETLNAQGVGARISGGSNYSLGSGSIAGQVPLALITVLFRPLAVESSNPMLILNGLEMLWFTILLARVLWQKPFIVTLRQMAAQPALLFCAGFVLSLGIGVGLNCSNLGTLSRYRMPLIPFYAALLVVLSSKAKPIAAGLVSRAVGVSRPSGPQLHELPRPAPH